MKKLTKLSILFLLTTTVFFGCKNQTPEEESLPGEWTEDSTFEDDEVYPYTGAKLTTTGNTVIFDYPEPRLIDNAPDENSYIGKNAGLTSASFKGFKANVKCTLDSSIPGFVFYGSSSESSYYLLIINPYQEISLMQKKGTTLTTIKDWTKFESINLNSKTNEVSIYTDDDGSICIMINSETVAKIENPTLKPGYIGVAVNVNRTEYDNNSHINVTYDFIEFQK